jgi:SAM-dependent methyltransferase
MALPQLRDVTAPRSPRELPDRLDSERDMNSDVLTSAEAQRLAEEATFADTAYAKFANQLALNETFFRKYAAPVHDWDWREWGAKRLGSVAGCRLLDYGCGAGEEAVYLAKLGAHVTAIDISPMGVQLTTERAKFNGVDGRLTAMRRCDPTEFPDESFEIVHGWHPSSSDWRLDCAKCAASGKRTGSVLRTWGIHPSSSAFDPKRTTTRRASAPSCGTDRHAASVSASRAKPFHHFALAA